MVHLFYEMSVNIVAVGKKEKKIQNVCCSVVLDEIFCNVGEVRFINNKRFIRIQKYNFNPNYMMYIVY